MVQTLARPRAISTVGRHAPRGCRRGDPALTAVVAARPMRLSSLPGRSLASAARPSLSASFRRSGHGPRVRCEASSEKALFQPGKDIDQVTVAMKFGGSSVRDADRMKEVAHIICSFPDQAPAVILSAMGSTTNLLLESGDLALATPPNLISSMKSLRAIKDLHRSTADELDVGDEVKAEIEDLLDNLEKLLTGVSLMQELTLRARDTLVSFGERLSTRIFTAYLNRHGVAARQFDAFDIGFVSNDDFTNGQLYEETYPKVRESLTRKDGEEPYIPVITGFLARGKETGAITTLGRGGSDLSATVVGKALGLREVQVWKDVDGVLTADPRLVSQPVVVQELTYEEATELAYFGATVLHPAAMRPAMSTDGDLTVRVKNSYNIQAPGTVIMQARDTRECLLTSIVKKSNVTMLDIVSTRMLGQYGFLAKVFSICADAGVSVDVVATSEVSVSLTLDPSKIWARELMDSELDNLMDGFKELAEVELSKGKDIISLICNVGRSSEILEITFRVLNRMGVNVEMISQGSSKTNIALIVDHAYGEDVVKALHKEFFEVNDALHMPPRRPQKTAGKA